MASRAPLPFDPIDEARRQWIDHGWRAAADGMSVVTSVIRVQQVLMVQIDRVLRSTGLSFARYEVLMLLHFSRQGELPLGKIGSRLQVQPGAVTNAVDRLEDDGLVSRRAHPTDGRTTLATLTKSGRRVALAATETLNRDVFEVVGSSGTRRRELFALLRDLRVDDFES